MTPKWSLFSSCIFNQAFSIHTLWNSCCVLTRHWVAVSGCTKEWGTVSVCRKLTNLLQQLSAAWWGTWEKWIVLEHSAGELSLLGAEEVQSELGLFPSELTIQGLSERRIFHVRAGSNKIRCCDTDGKVWPVQAWGHMGGTLGFYCGDCKFSLLSLALLCHVSERHSKTHVKHF